MGKFFGRRPEHTAPAEFRPARSLLRWAIGISLLFFAAHLAGWREYTCVLCGTVGSVNLGWQVSQMLALLYIFFYLGFVVVVPVLLLAVVLFKLGERFCRK